MSAADIDINSLNLENEPVATSDSTNADEFFAPPLPDDGEHVAILRAGDRGITVSRQKDSSGNRTGAAFLNVHVQLKILDETGQERLSVFDQLSSIPMGTGMSRLQAVLIQAGFGDEARGLKLPELKALTERVLAQNARVGITTQWEAQAEDMSKPKDAKGHYYTVLKGQKKFTPRDGGGYVAEVQDPKSGQTVRAQARVIKYSRV